MVRASRRPRAALWELSPPNSVTRSRALQSTRIITGLARPRAPSPRPRITFSSSRSTRYSGISHTQTHTRRIINSNTPTTPPETARSNTSTTAQGAPLIGGSVPRVRATTTFSWLWSPSAQAPATSRTLRAGSRRAFAYDIHNLSSVQGQGHRRAVQSPIRHNVYRGRGLPLRAGWAQDMRCDEREWLGAFQAGHCRGRAEAAHAG